MRKNWVSILAICTLFGLLILLAGFQYKWVGQISDSEKVRLDARVKDDARRFAEDFNRQIQSVYYSFQLDGKDIEKKDWKPFTKRLDFWRSKSRFPEIVSNFYFIPSTEGDLPLRYQTKSAKFSETAWTDGLKEINNEIKEKDLPEPVVEFDEPSAGVQLALVAAVVEKELTSDQTLVIEKKGEEDLRTRELHYSKPIGLGYLIIVLDKAQIRDKILANLAAKYFSGGEDGSYNVSIVNSKNENIFESGGKLVGSPDATARILDLKPNDLAFFPEKTGNSIIESQIREGKNGNIIVSETYRNETSVGKQTEESLDVSLKPLDPRKPRIAIFKGDSGGTEGAWRLDVQHSSGSIGNFIAAARVRNLLISFGILALLAVSMLLIFVASQRVKRLAQRQVDFVSSVTHEFRTPLSVIYSAGENLSDGVIDEKEKIHSYGALIKTEGKKLSEMVEQILEFAGARSGRRKYDLGPTNVKKVIDDALVECSHTIRNCGFVVETSVSEDLPDVRGDEKALTQAIQNIINNSLKYSNGSKWLKVSADKDRDWVSIAVEDKGIGISSRDQKYLFEPFYRSESVVNEQISGNGLGLSLVKQIIDGHSGKIAVKSELGKGSKFVILLPAEGSRG
ncbi:MAG: HAMP domain-containing histidine kinase [Acidobacteria bacterium]|nr:HAMP domain-containing histidine kinase [Acidobacteriota bacterium]